MNLLAKDIAQEFDLEIHSNHNFEINSPGSKVVKNTNTISWAKNTELLKKVNLGTVVCKISDYESIIPLRNVCYLVTDKSPRLIFAKILSKYFNNSTEVELLNYVDEHKKNKNIYIADFVFIGKDVQIGDGTIIHPCVAIYSKTIIGKNCVIKANTSIATEGLGLEFDPDTNEYFKFPQIGGVILEDNIEIGPSSTIRRSALDNTIIKSGSKIGALVNIGHNCIIGKNCILSCQNVTAGSSTLGENVFMGVGAVIKVGVNVGDNVTIGMGAVVTKNIPDNQTYIGNPAEPIEKYQKWSLIRENLISDND